MMRSACVFSIDNAYVMPFQVFFHSLEATASIPHSTPLFVLHDQSLSDHSILKLRDFLTGYERTASFLDASHLIPAKLPIRQGDHVSPATFFRLFIANILPRDIDQAVYLDADMLALGSIAQLFNENVSALIAAVDHCSPANEVRLWGPRGGTYFQAGVLVIPLQAWRRENMTQRFLQIMADQHESIQWWDQDVLNIALRDCWQRLPVWLNVCAAVQLALPKATVAEKAVLIHYTGSSKPWNSLRPASYAGLWYQGYRAAFQRPFNRRALLWSRLKSAIRSQLLGGSKTQR